MTKWTKLKNQGEKWELKHKGVVLGTIFQKPANKKFSVWISTPVVVKELTGMATKTYQFDSLVEAQQGFDDLLREQVSVWAEAVNDYIDTLEKGDA